MVDKKKSPIQIDLDQFKLYLNLPDQQAFSLHFDTPSRKFYISVIALVVEQMKKNNTVSVPMEEHAEVLALLNETVGRGAGSSKKEKLLPRIYRKWKDALPDLENAPLFKVVGRKKGYDDSSRRTYRFDSKTKDSWANLFEYRGSGEKVRLRFSAEKLGVELKDVSLVFRKPSGTDGGGEWNRFIEHLRADVKGEVQRNRERTGKKQDVPGDTIERIPGEDKDHAQHKEPELSPRSVELRYTGGDGLNDWLEKQGGIEKIPMKTRLEMIAQLAIALSAVHDSEGQYGRVKAESIPPGQSGESSFTDEGVPEVLIENISKGGNANMLYTAPELLDGCPPSPQSDVYSLGVLLYQLVVGDISRPLDPGWEQAVSDDILREDIALCVERLPENRLAHPVELWERLLTFDERRKLLELENPAEKNENGTFSKRQRKKRWLVYGCVLVVILVLITVVCVHQYKASQQEAAKALAYETALPEIRQLLDNEKYVAAHALARETEEIIPDDPTLRGYIQEATSTFDMVTMPAGARVSYRPYNDFKGPWIELGVSPITGAVVPVGMTRFKIQKEGYAQRELVRPVLPRDSLSAGYKKLRGISDTFQFNLYKKERVPEGMVPVDGGRFFVAIKGVPAKETIVNGPFFIDRMETTNRAYKEFVDAGGYGTPRYWKEEFKKDGQVIPWVEAIKAFVDRTGRPGPATWELGDYPEGWGDYPVSGISWYEAAAYARFCGKTLPTIYHWARAVFTVNETVLPLTPDLISQSNIEGSAVARVGGFPGIGSSGAKDMAGNVREWCWNAAGEENRYCLGGWWQDPAYVVNDSCVPSAWDRSEGNGVRCALYPEDALPSDTHLKPADLRFYDPYAISPRSDESFETLETMFAYEKGPLHPVVESRKAGGKGWIRETVTIDAAYGGERLIVHLDLPADCSPPYKAVIYWPGVSALYQPEFSRNFLWEPWDLIPKNGRALINPIYSNCFERGGGKPIGGGKSVAQRWFDRLNDLRKTIDYLETRKDIDTRNLAFLGVCWGGMEGPKISPYEERIKTLILVSGAIYLPMAWPKPDALTQALTKIPVLMLNGKYDYIFPVKTHQKPLFDLISTLPEDKKHVLYDCGHLPLPRVPMMKEIFAWLDKYQGPVNCDGNP